MDDRWYFWLMMEGAGHKDGKTYDGNIKWLRGPIISCHLGRLLQVVISRKKGVHRKT